MLITTSFLQKYPDYYNNQKDCDKFDKNYNRVQSNPRYKNFYQINFTAGDEEQFRTYKKIDEIKEETENNFDLSENIFKNSKYISNWDKYKHLDESSTSNTFNYLFNKFKKGIYVKIVNNELKVFLPFSNANFTNEWNLNIKIDPIYKGDISTFFKHVCAVSNRKFNKFTFNHKTYKWYANNSLLRYEYPTNENDTNVSCIKNMLEELCSNRQIPNIELFINRRDFPLLSKYGYEPYFHLWDSRKKPLISHLYSNYTPILSMSSSEDFADILIPTYEDWSRVQSLENKWFPKYRDIYSTSFTINWEDKIPTAIFRGSSTGVGVTIETNQRLKVAYISYLDNLNNGGSALCPRIDAGITKWNTRPKKISGEPYLQIINPLKFPFKLVPKISSEEQSKYKYIIYIDGHVSAFRLSYELSMCSVILLVQSEWRVWFSHILEPYVHYVPIKEDLSNLLEQIEWCRENDEFCRKIALNSVEFYKKYLCKNGILDYFQKIFIDLETSNS